MPELISGYDNSVIRVEMLGGFKITIGDVVISDATARTRQVWNLLEYLIANRHKSLSNDELIGVLWPNESSDQPSNALKNLVYRIRTLFANSGIPFAKDVISYDQGAYNWNRKLHCWVDIEEFESLYKRGMERTSSEKERADCFQQAIELFKGDFLSSSHYEEWVVPLSTYYHTIYFKCVYEAVELLRHNKEYASIEMVCQKATIIDQFEERVQTALLDALLKQGKQTQALARYNYVTDLFYRELGVSPSESLRTLYRDISKTINSVEMDLQVIKEDLNESSMVSGAYYCEYEVFKNMYRVEARGAARSGQSIFIGLITVTDPDDQIPEIKVLNRTMRYLLDTVKASLRKGDIISRFSATQYVLMLPTVTFENGMMVIERVIKRYKAEHGVRAVKIYGKLLPLDPVV